MAGPNVIESEEHIFTMCRHLKHITEECGVRLVFKSSFDKANRTSVKSFRGPGVDEGLKILQAAKTVFDVPIVTDIHDATQAEPVSSVADILQIPAFLCRQTDLLLAAGKTGKVVNIKKGQFCSASVMRNSAEKVRCVGNPNVMVCERGTMFGYSDLIVDTRNLMWMRDCDCPVVADITHSLQQPAGRTLVSGGVASGGLREMIPCVARACAAVGVDGLFMEVHDNPTSSPVDGPTQWPDRLKEGRGYGTNDENSYLKVRDASVNFGGDRIGTQKIEFLRTTVSEAFGTDEAPDWRLTTDSSGNFDVYRKGTHPTLGSLYDGNVMEFKVDGDINIKKPGGLFIDDEEVATIQEVTDQVAPVDQTASQLVTLTTGHGTRISTLENAGYVTSTTFNSTLSTYATASSLGTTNTTVNNIDTRLVTVENAGYVTASGLSGYNFATQGYVQTAVADLATESYVDTAVAGVSGGVSSANPSFTGRVYSTGEFYTDSNKSIIRGTSPTLYLRDTDNSHRSGMVHMNDSRM